MPLFLSHIFILFCRSLQRSPLGAVLQEGCRVLHIPSPQRLSSAAVWSAAVAMLTMMALSTPAGAAELRINGVEVGKVQVSVLGLEGMTFEGCNTVKVDKSGVDISCPGYDLAASGGEEQPAVVESEAEGEATLTQRYWVIPNQNVRGRTHYDIDLYINGKWIRRFRNNEDITAVEVTSHLVPGRNRFLFRSAKNKDARQNPGSDEHFFRLVVGEGESRSGRVLIERPLFEIRRLASEVEDFTEERQLITR